MSTLHMGFVQAAKYELTPIPCLSSSIKNSTNKRHPVRPPYWHAKEVDLWLIASVSSLRWLAGVRRWEKKANERRRELKAWLKSSRGLTASWKKPRNLANLWRRGYRRPPSAKIKQGICALSEISCSAHLCSSMLTLRFHWCTFQATKRVQKRRTNEA